MNKLKLLIPTIAVMATTPLTALCGCTVYIGGGDTPEPEPEPEPDQPWNWQTGTQAQLHDIILMPNTQHTFFMKNFEGMSLEKASELDFFISDGDGGREGIKENSVKVYFNKNPIPKVEPDTDDGYWIESGCILHFKKTISKSDSFKIELEFNITSEISNDYAVINMHSS